MSWGFRDLVLPLAVALFAFAFAVFHRVRGSDRVAIGTDRGGAKPAGFAAVAAGLALLAAFVAFAHEPGWYLGDNRFVHNWAPQRSFASIFTVWNPEVDLGGPTQHYLPVTDSFMMLVRSVGFEPWLAQRFWFAAVLCIGAIGTAAVARAALPGARAEALLAGAWFVCAPFTSGFFFPTALLLNVSLCPWFVLAVWRGATTDSRWRWAAVFALALATAGSHNPPGLAMALVPAVIIAVGLVAGREVGLRSMLSWSARALALSMLALAPVVVRSVMSSETLARNLGSTESVDAVSRSSSWAESLRGLGFWLQYWNPRGPLVFPYLTVYFTNWYVIAATFVPVAVAVAAVVFGRRRIRLVMGVVLAVAAAAMVGAYPVSNPAPLGSALRRLYDASPALFAFRNVYKAGAGLVLAVAVLSALAMRELRERNRREGPPRRVRTVLAAGAIALVLVPSGWPLLSGDAFAYGQRLHGDVPDYWREAFSWLDAQPGAGRVLVLPGSSVEAYRWGSAAGGDIFPSLLDRPAIFAQPLTGSPAEAANLTVAIDRFVTSGRYEPGTLAPILRRLGVQYVVVRNDLDWQAAGVARPQMLQGLRDDETLALTETFGRQGENVTGPDDETASADDERRLHPVEVFVVPGVDDVVRAVTPAPAVLVSGDGAAWSVLARSAALDTLGPIRYTAPLDAGEVAAELDAGASVVLSDTNRRRPLAWGQEQRTLTALDTDRVDDLFEGVEGSQSVTTFGDAVRIAYAGPASLWDPGLAHRPSAAFDGDPTTAWLTGVSAASYGQAVRVELAEPHSIDEVGVRVAVVDGGRTVSRVAVVVPGEEPFEFDVEPGTVNALRIPPQTTDELVIVPLEVEGDGGGPFGLAEVEVPGLDLAERVVLPDDLARLADSSPEVGAPLADAAFSVELQRLTGLPRDPEGALNRRFRLPVGRPFELQGSLQVTPAGSATGVARLLRSELWIDAVTSGIAPTGGEPVRAFDGDTATSWELDSAPVSTFVAGVQGTRGNDVRSARLVLRVHGGADLPHRLDVVRGDVETRLDPARSCRRGGEQQRGEVRIVTIAGEATCSVELTWPADAPLADNISFTVSPTTLDSAGGWSMTIAEVELNDRANALAYRADECREDLVVLDGRTVGVRPLGALSELLAGTPVAIEACTALELSSGWHELSTVPGLPLDWARFVATDGREPVPASAVEVEVVERGAVEHTLRLDAPAGTRVVLGQAYSPGWRASTESGTLATLSLDVQAGWVLAEGGPQEIRVGQASQALFARSADVALATLGVLVALVIADPRRAALARVTGARRQVVPGWLVPASLAATLVFATLVGGWPSLLVVAVAVVCVERGWLSSTAIGAAAVALVVLAALATIPPLGPPLEPVWPLWPAQRGLAHHSARLAVLLTLVCISGVVAEMRRSGTVEPRARDESAPP